MEFLEKQKEFTHRSNKPLWSKYITQKVDRCTKCHGNCIFSKTFFEQYPKSAAFREKLDERFYAEEFKYLRSLETKPKLEDKEIIIQSKYLQEDDREEESALTTFDLLRKFHSLERSEKANIGKLHHNSGFSSSRVSKRLENGTKSSCDCSRCSSGRLNTTRQKKNRKLVFNNICDVRLEC